MRRALEEFVIEGVKTTIPFHRQLMDNPDFATGTIAVIVEKQRKIHTPQGIEKTALLWYPIGRKKGKGGGCDGNSETADCRRQ